MHTIMYATQALSYLGAGAISLRPSGATPPEGCTHPPIRGRGRGTHALISPSVVPAPPPDRRPLGRRAGGHPHPQPYPHPTLRDQGTACPSRRAIWGNALQALRVKRCPIRGVPLAQGRRETVLGVALRNGRLRGAWARCSRSS